MEFSSIILFVAVIFDFIIGLVNADTFLIVFSTAILAIYGIYFVIIYRKKITAFLNENGKIIKIIMIIIAAFVLFIVFMIFPEKFDSFCAGVKDAVEFIIKLLS